jgi:hypothetical protein
MHRFPVIEVGHGKARGGRRMVARRARELARRAVSGIPLSLGHVVRVEVAVPTPG